MDRPELPHDQAESASLADEGRATRLLMHAIAEVWDAIDDRTRLRPARWATEQAGAAAGGPDVG